MDLPSVALVDGYGAVQPLVPLVLRVTENAVVVHVAYLVMAMGIPSAMQAGLGGLVGDDV